jgi:hypothetical protein
MAAKTAFEHLDQILAEHPHSPASTRIPVTLGELRDINGRLVMLTDMVVTAAALWFDQIKDQREADYASECLHETASDLVKTNPRLRGAFDGDI